MTDTPPAAWLILDKDNEPIDVDLNEIGTRALVDHLNRSLGYESLRDKPGVQVQARRPFSVVPVFRNGRA